MKIIGNVILVDDSTTQLKMLEMILSDENFNIKTFTNGLDTIKYLNSMDSSLSTVIITDMDMPGMSGMELTERITQEFDKNKFAVIALTEFGDVFTLKEVFDKGATDYVPKPAKKIELLPRIRNILTSLNNARELKEKEQRLSDILLNVQTGIVIIDAESHKIVDANPMATKLIGLKKEQIVNNICHKFICPAEKGKCPITDLNKNVSNEEKTLVTSKGDIIPILKTASLTEINGKKHLIESFLDISKMKKLQEELKALSVKDPLTGLFNRRHFYEITELELNRTLRTDRDLSFIMIDLDKFKNVNDTYGHQTGDKVLVTFAKKASSFLREYDVICRFGGEEFSILCPESNLEKTVEIAERIRKGVEKIIVLYNNNKIKFTVSIGVTRLLKEDKTIDSLIKRADSALYQAKKTGRNKVCTQL